MSNNLNLNRANAVKDDEFYTPFKFIEVELDHYDFGGRPIVCPCDGENSGFVKYFRSRGIEPTFAAGDYEAVLYADAPKDAIVVTNPPFSLFRRFVCAVLDRGLDLLVVGPNIAAKAPDIFPYIKDGRLRGGYTCDRSISFERPGGGFKNAPVSWFTSLPVDRRPFTPSRSFADLRAAGKISFINDTEILFVDKIANLPADWFGEAAVPANAFYRFNDGWEFVGLAPSPRVGDKIKFGRIVVKRKI